MAFGAPKPYIPPTPPPASDPIDAAVLEARRREKKRASAMGRQADLLYTSPQGDQKSPTLAVPSLLGVPGGPR